MWTLPGTVILLIIIVYLLILTYAGQSMIRMIPKIGEGTSIVHLFVVVFIQLLILAAVVYAIFNWLLTPIIGISPIDFQTAILYWIIVFVIVVFIATVFTPGRGAPLA